MANVRYSIRNEFILRRNWSIDSRVFNVESKDRVCDEWKVCLMGEDDNADILRRFPSWGFRKVGEVGGRGFWDSWDAFQFNLGSKYLLTVGAA